MVPQAALAIDPLASDIRVEAVVDALQQPSEDSDLQIEGSIQTGIRFSPLDARFYSLLGILEERRGQEATAERLFRHALIILPTEIQALTHLMGAAIRDGNFAVATRNAEIIARRWPRFWPRVEPLLANLLKDPQAFQTITDQFGRDVLIRHQLVASMIRNEALLSPAYRMVLAWHDAGVADIDPSVNRLTSALLKAGRSSDAYRLFVLTRPKNNESTGFVYNGSFGKALSGNPFDWLIQPQAGADISIVDRRTSDSVGSGDAMADRHAVAIRFLGSPLHFKNISQLTRLTPGQYEFEAGYSSVDLRTPEPLKVGLSCQGKELGHLDVATGTSTDQRSAAFRFSVPATGCELQRIETYSAQLPLSWRYRYEGTLFLDHIRIRRLDD